MVIKSANQLYRESGTTLSFKEWIEAEKANTILNNVPLNNVIEKEIQKLKKDMVPSKPSNKIFGLNQNIIIVSGIIILSAVAYKILNKK